MGRRRVPFRGAAAAGIPRLLVVLFSLALGLTTACTFERRPQTQVNADPGRIQAPVPRQPAGSFLEELQMARSSGSEAEVRSMLHPRAVVMTDGRILPLDGEAWSVLLPDPSPEGRVAVVTDSAVFEGAAFFVLGYDKNVETLVLARDSAGWALRLLQQTSGDDPSP